MPQEKKELLLMTAAALAAVVVFAVFAPRFLFREIRIIYELDRLGSSLKTDVMGEISYNDIKIADYYGNLSHMYAKLELSARDYEEIKRILLNSADTATHRDYSDEITSETSGYRYDPSYFASLLRTMNNIRRINKFLSINVDDYKELLMLEDTYGKWFSSGNTIYALVKENSGGYFLYIYAR